ncbi:MAG: hypothetical protein GY856_43725, partial [bacterium]|nr:hypothetical protein [bacterium]
DETGDTARLTFIQLGALKEPDSCAGRVFNVPNKFPTFPVRAWTVDPGLEAAAWIDLDGAVYRWQAGRREQLLVPPRGAPPSAALRRVYQLGGRLLLTTDDAVYSYRLSDHSWYRHRIPSPSGAARFVDLNLEPSPSERLTVTAHAGDGSVYVGQLHPGADNTVQLDRLLIPRARRRSGQGLNPERLRDVQEGPDGRWRFLFDDRLKSFDPSTRTWDRDLVFPAPADPTVTLRRALDRDVLVKDSGRTWWIAQDGSERASAVYPRGSDRAAAIDRDGRVWRLPADGRVRRCTARGGSYDVCEDHGGADMLIDPQRIASAWELDDWILFVGAGGSRVYDREQHRELRGLPPAVSRVTVVQQALKSSGNHWLLVDDGRLLRLDRQKRWRSSRASRLAVDRRDNVWVRGPDGWRRWNGERFSDPLAGRQDLRMLDLVDAQTPAVIHRSGMIFRYESGRFTELGRLPGHLDPDAVRTVIRSAPGRSWWVHHGRDLVRLAPTSGAAAPDRSPEIELPSAEVEILTVAVREGGRFHLRFSDGSGWEIDELAKAGRPVSPPSRPYFRLSDQWPMLKRQILVRPDGRNVFDGVIDLDHHAKGHRFRRRRPDPAQ